MRRFKSSVKPGSVPIRGGSSSIWPRFEVSINKHSKWDQIALKSGPRKPERAQGIPQRNVARCLPSYCRNACPP